MNNWIVITGGPCSGKTTTINLLKEQGFKVSEEAARKYYESQLNLGFTNEEIKKDPQKLQDSIAKMLVEIEDSLNPEEEVFLDRGIPDNIAYYEYFNITPPEFLKEAFQNCSYKKVFYLENVPHVKDEVRTESEEEVAHLSQLTHKYYAQKKIDMITVPLMDKHERVEFILKHF